MDANKRQSGREKKASPLPLQVHTGNAVVDSFFAELDARLAGDPRLSEAQKALLRKARPEMARAALADPDHFERAFGEVMRSLQGIGWG
jgi:hypothetical protein